MANSRSESSGSALPRAVTKSVIVALDLSDTQRAMDLVRLLTPYVGGFKVGHELYLAAGPLFIRHLVDMGVMVFLDLKFHDIPSVVGKAVAAATNLGVGMLTVHALGGEEMLKEAVEAAKKAAAVMGRPPPLVLAVTILTSSDQNTLDTVGIPGSLPSIVHRLAYVSINAGVSGLVCAASDLSEMRRTVPQSIQLVTPGIRLASSPPDDQKRTTTAKEALALGATWLVVGRPITTAADPLKALQDLVA